MTDLTHDANLALLQSLTASRAGAQTIRAAARVLARAGMQDAHLYLLEHADEILDGVNDEAAQS